MAEFYKTTLLFFRSNWDSKTGQTAKVKNICKTLPPNSKSMIFERSCNSLADASTYLLTISPVHKLLGNFPATLGFLSNFQLVEQLSVHRATFKFFASIVTDMLLLQVKHLKSAEYSLCQEYICPIF